MRDATFHGPYDDVHWIAHGTPLLRAAPEHEKPPRLDRAKAALQNIRGRGITQLINVPKSNKRRRAEIKSADDIIICARSSHELGQLVGSLTIHLEQVGLLLNADKTVVLTNGAQPPPILATDGGLKLAILQGNVGQKWLGCMLAAEGSQSQHIDLEYHAQQASKSFYANLIGPKRFHFQTLEIFQCRGLICRMLW